MKRSASRPPSLVHAGLPNDLAAMPVGVVPSAHAPLSVAVHGFSPEETEEIVEGTTAFGVALEPHDLAANPMPPRSILLCASLSAVPTGSIARPDRVVVVLGRLDRACDAVAALRAGADDYVAWGDWARLAEIARAFANRENSCPLRPCALRATGADSGSTVRDAAFRHLFGHLELGVWLRDVRGNAITYVNSACERLIGHSGEDLQAGLAVWIDSIHPDDRARVLHDIEQTEVGRPTSTTARFLRADGTTRWFRIRRTLIADLLEPGDRYSAGIIEDVTELRAVQEALRLRDRAIEAAVESIVLTDHRLPGNPIVYVNPAFERLTGFTQEEIIGRRGRVLQAPGADPAVLTQLLTALVEGCSCTVEVPIARKNGTRYWAQLSMAPLRNETGELTHHVWMHEDITERKRIEEDLRRSEQAYQAMVDHAPIGIAVTDSNGGWMRVNDRFLQIVGYTREELEGTDLYLITHPDDRDQALSRLPALLNKLEGPVSQQKRYLRKDGTPVWVDVTASVLRREESSAAYITAVIDITDRKAAEEALRDSNARLERTLDELRQTQEQAVQQERLRAMGEMASGIAHDFNNALTPILGFSELLLHRPGTDESERVQRYLRLIHTAAHDAASVVSRLREFYRFREADERFQPVDLAALAREVMDLTQPRWKDQSLSNGITLDVRTELAAVPFVSANAANLKEVLTNLIFNSVDAMPEGGVLTLRTRAEGSNVVLEVIDTGIGMSEEVRQRCLEPFYTTKGPQGTGLGLAVVQGILNRHDAVLEIDSAPHRGTVVRLRFPTALTTRRDPSSPARAGIPPLHILWVDDEPMIRDLVSDYLKSMGHTVETAATGRDGLVRFLEASLDITAFDLVITDHAMPDMNGEQLAAALKRVAPTVPVLLVTGFGEFMEASGESPAHVDGVLSKPVRFADLDGAIARVMKVPVLEP